MKNKIKNYFATPLTKGWLWKNTIISAVLITLIGGVSLWKMGLLSFKAIFSPSDDWEDIPESKD